MPELAEELCCGIEVVITELCYHHAEARAEMLVLKAEIADLKSVIQQSLMPIYQPIVMFIAIYKPTKIAISSSFFSASTKTLMPLLNIITASASPFPVSSPSFMPVLPRSGPFVSEVLLSYTIANNRIVAVLYHKWMVKPYEQPFIQHWRIAGSIAGEKTRPLSSTNGKKSSKLFIIG